MWWFCQQGRKNTQAGGSNTTIDMASDENRTEVVASMSTLSPLTNDIDDNASPVDPSNDGLTTTDVREERVWRRRILRIVV